MQLLNTKLVSTLLLTWGIISCETNVAYIFETLSSCWIWEDTLSCIIYHHCNTVNKSMLHIANIIIMKMVWISISCDSTYHTNLSKFFIEVQYNEKLPVISSLYNYDNNMQQKWQNKKVWTIKVSTQHRIWIEASIFTS